MKINGNPDGGGGGAAVWGGITGNINSQADLNAQFAKKNGLKTINNESIVGSGNIEVGGLDPEQEAAVEVLTDASEGVLYTNVLSPYSFSLLDTSAPNISQNLKNVYDVGDGEIYYKYGSELYKYNADIKDFEKVADFRENLQNAIWKDNTGRLYDGKNYVLDIENNTRTYITSSTGYGIQGVNGTNRYNIFRGNKGIYDLNNNTFGNTKSYKFKEDTQTFNTGQYVQGTVQNAVRLSFYFEYKNHFLFAYNSFIYEITEGDDEVLTTTDVTGTYFNMPDFTITPQNIFVKDGVLYYISSEEPILYVYDEVEGEWNEITLTQTSNDSYVIKGDYLIGGVSSEDGLYFLSLADEEEITTSWKPINSMAVDLNSQQRITGNKSFASLDADSINVGQISLTNNTGISPDGNNMKVEAADLILNDKSVATKDFCIYNNVLESPGSAFNVECRFPAAQGPQGQGVDMNWKMFYATPGGRLVHINDYRNNVCFEYDDDTKSWNTLSTVTNIVSTPFRALVDVEGNGVKLWVAKNGVAYKWNDTTGDFDYIIATPDSINDIWAGDGTTLRCGTNYVLSYDNVNDTYSWVNATTIPGWSDDIFSYIINGNTYVYVKNDQYIYSWDESTGTLTPVGTLRDTPKGDGDYLAQVGNYLYYYNSNSGINRIDVNAQEDFDTTADIFVGQAEYGNLPPIIEHQGKCWTGNYVSWTNYNWGWTGAITPTPIAAPQTDGNYVLKATVLNGQVTYTWAEDVDAQAIQITNQILG